MNMNLQILIKNHIRYRIKNLDLGRGPVISYTDLNDINQIKSNNLTGYTLFYSILVQ